MGTNARRPITSEHLAALKEHGTCLGPDARAPSMQWQSTSPRLLRAARISMIAHTAGMDVEYHVIASAMVGLRLCPSSRPT
jgi:hypothetical protein